MPGFATIYYLRDETGAIRYVGVTTVALALRLKEHRTHRNRPKNGAPRLAAAMRAGQVFTIEAVRPVPYAGRMQAETAEVERLRDLGHGLLNETTDERRARLSKAGTYAKSPEHKAKLRKKLVQFRGGV